MRIPIHLLFFTISFQQLSAQTLVLPGDYPDPSVVKIGDTYWASATTSNWLPAYPLLKSKDLISWSTVDYAFKTKPAWADFYFWAPEISHENGKTYIYYTAHKKDGNLCIAVASADKPEGPYQDHGTLMCQEVGSIDAFPMRDENGKLYMIWKEDGNSVGKPTPIWAMEMNEARTALTGEQKELFRADAKWENNLVEGVSMIRRGEYYYAFYAASACCGRGCTYGTGIARAKNLLGPWEKDPKNPVLAEENSWKCPGHGTVVEKDGKYYFLYHAYNKESNVYAGRQGLLIGLNFTPDGWIRFEKTTDTNVNIVASVHDNFKSKTPSKNWQWSVFQDVKFKTGRKKLILNALPTSTGAFIGQKTFGSNYTVNVTLLRSTTNTATGGLALIGDEKNVVSLLLEDNKLLIHEVKNNEITVLAQQSIGTSNQIQLRMQVRNGKDITFFYSLNGKDYKQLNTLPADGTFLPPWDRAVRVGLVAKGEPTQQATFKQFSLKTDIATK